MKTEDLTQSIHLVKKYANYKIHQIWSISLLIISTLNILFVILFDATSFVDRNSELIYGIQISIILIVLILLVLYSFFSVKKLVIKESKVVTRVYFRLAIALFILFFYLAILPLKGELMEMSLLPDEVYTRFPYVLGGYLFNINGCYTLVTWGVNIAMLAAYFLLRQKSKGLRRIELLVGFTLLTIYDGLTFYIDPFVVEREFMGEYTYFISSIIIVLCGIFSLIMSIIYLKKQNSFEEIMSQ